MQKSGTSQLALEAAYAAAAAAASQLPSGKKPFLVTACEGPTFTARGGYQVHTTPLGFHKRLVTERVRMTLHVRAIESIMNAFRLP